MKKLIILSIIALLSVQGFGQFTFTIARYDSTATSLFIRLEKPKVVSGNSYIVSVEHFYTASELATQASKNLATTWLVSELQVKYNSFVAPTVYKAANKTAIIINQDSLNWFGSILMKQDWIGEAKPYTLTDTVKYENRMYKCLQAHTSQSDWYPSIVPALWQRIVFTPPNTLITWQEGLTYQVNSFCQYLGKKYKCLQTHTAYIGTGWTPPATPSLWQFIQNL